MLRIPTDKLLLVAAAVWFLAGANIVNIGVQAIPQAGTGPLLLMLGMLATFLAFHAMFTKILGKHSTRIRDYQGERTLVFKFFDAKAYLLMAVMMGGGISLRAFGLVPSWFVAFFYTGLGTALALAGVGFLVHYLKRGGTITCPVTKKTRLA